MGDKIRIAVVDDHPMLREGVIQTLARQPDFEVVGESDTGEGAVRLAEAQLPDVMLLDVSLPGGGLAAARAISTSCPVVKIAMLTVAEDEETVSAALAAGARGYILKGISGPDLVGTVRSIHAGEDYVSPSLAARLLAEMASPAGERSPMPASSVLATLHPREEQILALVAQGMSNRAIGERLGLSEKTIKHYMTNILQKLRVKSRVEAALFAQQLRSADMGGGT